MVSRSSGEWNEDDFDVLANGVVASRIFKSNSSPVGASWMWTLAFGHHEYRTPTHGYAGTREAAMAAGVDKPDGALGHSHASMRARETPILLDPWAGSSF
jgi:hypothetical protein